MSDSVYSNRGLYSQNNFPNALDFIARSIIKQMVNTAIPVLVEAVFPGDDAAAGYVQCLPLVMPRDPQNQSIQTVSIPKLPFFRLYAGRSAIVCDPVPGDVGLAIFAQQDCSLVKKGTNTPQPAGTFRCFDMSDGFYFGGFYNGNGDTNIVFDQQGNITINAPTAQTVNTTNCVVNATEKITFNSPEAEFTGNVMIDKGLTVIENTVSESGDVIASGISLKSHTHSGVESGSSSTGGPQ